MTREEALKILMGYSHTTQERAALEVLIPELNENKDERIRKAIRVILIATEDEQKDFYSTHGLTRKDCTDWLEKQERKPAEVDESTKRLNDNWMRQHFDDYNERESAEWAKWAELQSEFKNINEAFEDGKKEVVAHPEKYGLCKRIEATINGEPIPTENQSVNLPLAEWNPMKFKEGDKVIIHCAPERKKDIFSIYDGQEGTIDAIWDLAANPWGNIKVTLPNGCNNTFYDSELELISKNEPKQEWSEEDKIKLDNCCAVIAQPEVYFDTSSRQKSLDFLYGLPKRFALPPKPEWSEEDSDNLERVDNYLWMLDHYVGDDCATPQGKADKIRENIQEVLSPWIKSLPERFSLQPKKELSIEKAIQWLDDTFYFLDNSSGRGRDCEITTHDFDSLEEMYDSFRKAVIVDSEPYWKPSEAQMEMLKYTIDYYGSCTPNELVSLYEQLKKL